MSLMKLGQKVRVKAFLKRTKRKHVFDRQMHFSKMWDRTEYVPAAMEEGIVVRKVTLSNGFTDYDEGYFWCAMEHFDAHLVAFDLNRKPIVVLAEDLEEIE